MAKRNGKWVAETLTRLTRDAKPSQKKQKKLSVPGEPVDARLVVSRILSDDGQILAEWLLLNNVKTVEASEIGLWNYWRWQIKCFFKLLKKAGHDLESWQQETGLATDKRLLVVSMAYDKGFGKTLNVSSNDLIFYAKDMKLTVRLSSGYQYTAVYSTQILFNQ